MAARSGLSVLPPGALLASRWVFALVGLCAAIVGLRDMQAVSATAPGIMAGLLAGTGALMIYAAFPLGASRSTQMALRFVAALAALAATLLFTISRLLFTPADWKLLVCIVVCAVFAALAVTWRAGWTSLRGAALRLITGGAITISAIVSFAETVYVGLHPKELRPLTLNVSTNLQSVGTRDDLALVSGKITFSNPGDERVNVLGSQYYVARLALPDADDPANGTMRGTLAKAGTATSQEWLNPRESTTLTFVAAVRRRSTAIARLYAVAVVGRGDVGRRASSQDGPTVTRDIRPMAGRDIRPMADTTIQDAPGVTYDIRQAGWILRFAQGQRHFDVQSVPAQSIANVTQVRAPKLTVGGIQSEGGLLRSKLKGNSVTQSLSTDSTYDLLLSQGSR